MDARRFVMSACFGLVMGMTVGMMALVRSLSLTPALVVFALSAPAAGLGSHVLTSSDRQLTREQRLDQPVKYLPTWRRRH